MDWALEKNDPRCWLPKNAIRLQSIRTLMESSDGGFSTALYHYMYHERFPRRSKEDYRIDAEVFLASLEARLQLGRYLVGDAVSLADAAILPFVFIFANVDKAWFENSSYQQLRSWLQGFQECSLLQKVMLQHPPWQPGDAPIFLHLEQSLPAHA